MTDKIKKLEQRKKEIIRRIKITEKLKKGIIDKAQELVLKYRSREISHFEYLDELDANFKKRTAQQWADYYDQFIKLYGDCLSDCEKKIKREKIKSIVKKTAVIMMVLGILAFSFIFLYPKEIILLAPPDVHTQTIDLITSKNLNYTWNLENLGNLQSASISGLLEGEGTVKVYLENLLIFDSTDFKPSILLSPEEEPVEEEPSTEEEAEPEQEEPAEETVEEEPTVEEEIEPESEPEEETPPAREPAEEPETEPEPEEEPTEEQEEVEEPIKIPEETIEEKVIEEAPGNLTKKPEEPKEPKEEIEILIREFTDYCAETCDLSKFDLNKESYTLRIEITDAVLKLDTITYEVIEEAVKEIKVPENITKEIPKIQKGKRQYKAIINRPVKWIQIIDVEEALSNIKLPKEAKDISIKINEEVQEALVELDTFKETIKTANRNDFISETIPKKIIQGLELQEEITETVDSKIIDLEEIFKQTSASEIAVEYYTDGPSAVEEITEKGKKVVVSAPDKLNYTDVLAFAEIPEKLNVGQESGIKIYWKEEDKYINFDAYDLDNNGKLDYVEWIVPHLSNQTFEVVIINAEHLNKKRKFIENIYNEVNETDNLTYTIPKKDYLRAYFERNLTNKDIMDVFVRNTESATIKVYEKDSSVLVGSVEITGEGFYYIELNHPGNQSVFDLKSITKDIIYDYVHDAKPALINSVTVTGPTSNIQIGASGTFNMQCEIATGTGGNQVTNIYFRLDTDDNGCDLGDTLIPEYETAGTEIYGDITTVQQTLSASTTYYFDTLITGYDIGGPHTLCCHADPTQGGRPEVVSSQTHTIEVTEANQAPTVNIISIDSDNFVDLIPASTTSTQIIFDVTDPQGVSDIDESTLYLSYSKIGETTRETFGVSSCDGLDVGNTRTYTCDINMEFYDDAGTWDAYASIQDFGSSEASDNAQFTVNLLRAIALNPPTITFPPTIPGGTDYISLIDTIITNDGNSNIPADSQLQITSQALIGQTNPTENIPGNNFQVASSSQVATVCTTGGTNLIQDSPITIPNILLPKGPSSTETLRYCLTSIPTGLSAQPYSSTGLNAWDISVVTLSLLIVTRKKKKKKPNKSKENSLETLTKDIEEMLNFVKKNKIKSKNLESPIKQLSDFIKEYKLKSKTQNIKIPLDIFKQQISPADLKFVEIAKALNRDQRTVWINYKNAIKKKKDKIKPKGKLLVPINIFANKKLSILESTVRYLKERKINNAEIAEIINKNPSNIWTINKRAINKSKTEKCDKEELKTIKISFKKLKNFIEKDKSETQNIKIPLDIFKQQISPAEALCKYLKFVEIAKALNRDQRTVWINYKNAIKKKKDKIKPKGKPVLAIVNVFADRKLSVLESTVRYLKERKTSNAEIAEIINKTPSNIWTVNQRAIRKMTLAQ